LEVAWLRHSNIASLKRSDGRRPPEGDVASRVWFHQSTCSYVMLLSSSSIRADSLPGIGKGASLTVTVSRRCREVRSCIYYIPTVRWFDVTLRRTSFGETYQTYRRRRQYYCTSAVNCPGKQLGEQAKTTHPPTLPVRVCAARSALRQHVRRRR